MNTFIRRSVAATTLAAGFALLSSTTAAAQSSGPRWAAWVGCWTASVPGQSALDFGKAPVICVSPTSNPNVVELLTLGETKVLARDTIDASGTEQTLKTKNCTGTQAARWSADERRVYLKSTSTCDGLKSTTTAILAMSSNGDWLDVRALNAGEGSDVRVARYRAVQMPALLDSLSGESRNQLSVAARIAAGAPVGVAAITDAVKNVDSRVVESWILERGQAYALDANMLIQLADAGTPSNVTDAMIAISNPGAFKVARANRDDDDSYAGRRVYGGVMTPSSCDPYSRYYDPFESRYSAYDCSRYGYGYGYNRGYGYGYGYGGYYGGYYGPTVIVVSGPTIAEPRAQAVKGRGYTQNNGSSGTKDRGTATPSGSTSTTSTSTSSGSTTAAPAKTDNSSTNSGRTAHTRP